MLGIGVMREIKSYTDDCREIVSAEGDLIFISVILKFLILLIIAA